MAIKNLLVAYNGGAASDAALRFAIQMAKKYDCPSDRRTRPRGVKYLAQHSALVFLVICATASKGQLPSRPKK